MHEKVTWVDAMPQGIGITSAEFDVLWEGAHEHEKAPEFSKESVVRLGNKLRNLEVNGLQLCVMEAIKQMPEGVPRIQSNILDWLIQNGVVPEPKYNVHSAAAGPLEALVRKGLVGRSEFRGGPSAGLRRSNPEWTYALNEKGEEVYRSFLGWFKKWPVS